MDHDASPDDAALIAGVRHGRTDLYAELYRRHGPMAQAYARRLTRSPEDASDVVSEAFARLLAMLRRGAGPTEEFRPYLTRTIRNIAYDRALAERRVELTDETSLLERPVPFSDTVIDKAERALARQAFHRLPERWQQVLWLTCVEGRSIDSASVVLGTNANALTSLAYRAREGLRQAYLQENVPVASHRGCAPHVSRLAALVRGSLGPSVARATEAHLESCTDCARLHSELCELNAEVREQVVPRRTATRRPERLVSVLASDGGERDVWTDEQVA